MSPGNEIYWVRRTASTAWWNCQFYICTAGDCLLHFGVESTFFLSTSLYFGDKWNGKPHPRICKYTHTHTHLFCQDYCAHSSSVDPLLPCVCGSSEVNKTSFDQPRSMQRSKWKKCHILPNLSWLFPFNLQCLEFMHLHAPPLSENNSLINKNNTCVIKTYL